MIEFLLHPSYTDKHTCILTWINSHKAQINCTILHWLITIINRLSVDFDQWRTGVQHLVSWFLWTLSFLIPYNSEIKSRESMKWLTSDPHWSEKPHVKGNSSWHVTETCRSTLGLEFPKPLLITQTKTCSSWIASLSQTNAILSPISQTNFGSLWGSRNHDSAT